MSLEQRDFNTHRLDEFCFRSLYVNSINDTKNTILYVGGAFQSLEDLYLVKRHLCSISNLILLELPGFGRSDRLPSNYGFDFYAKCIHITLSSYTASNVVGYGYSYGVGPMLKASSKYSELFKAVIFAGACPSFTDTMISGMKNLIGVSVKDPASFPIEFEKLLCHPNKNELLNGRRSAVLLRRMLRSQPGESLQRFRDNYLRLLNEHQAVDIAPVPALLMAGQYDSFINPARLKEFEPYCKYCVIKIIQGCDHFFHLQNSSIDKELIEDFLKYIPSKQYEEL